MKKTVRYNILYQVGYHILTVITPLITSPYLSRVLGAEKLGIFSSTYAYVCYFVLTSMLGIESYGSREIATICEMNNKEKLAKKFWSIYIIQFIASVISIGVYYFSILLFVYEYERWIISILQGIWIFSAMLDLNWFFWGCEQFKVTVVRNVLIKICTIIAILVFVNTPEDLWIYVVIMAGSSVFSQAILWCFIKKKIVFCKIYWYEIKNQIFPIVKLFIPILAMSVFHIMDKTMLDIFSDDINCGYYYNVDRLANIPLSVVTGLNTVMLPRISKMQENKSFQKNQMLSFLERSFELTISLVVAISFGLASIAPIFVPIFFGIGFEPCINLILYYVPILIIKACSAFICQQFLIPIRREKYYVIATVFGAIFNLCANYFLIIRYAALGAVIGTLIAEGIVLITEIILIRKELNFMKLFYHHFAYFIFGFIMLFFLKGVIAYIETISIFLLVFLIILGMLVFMLCCFIYSYYKKDSVYHKNVKGLIDGVLCK